MTTKPSKSKRAMAFTQAKSGANVARPVVETLDGVGANQLSKAEVSVTNKSIVASTASDMVSLPASCTVRDCAALKVELMPLFEHAGVITIDMRAVERVDTSMLQLLLAFVRDRKEAQRVTKWVGEPECVIEAISILGMTAALDIHPNDAGVVA